jgi:hypothetical protein
MMRFMESRLGFCTMLTAHEPVGVRCPRFSVLPRPRTLKGGQQTERFMGSRDPLSSTH